ncbi:MAG: LysR family transcriptional regulator [Burkholderiales bacterium]|jgi:DNA-binding transcriptional LysR family regulator|nr:LysR family transcriptional regulator [Burkholderiales bacterium]
MKNASFRQLRVFSEVAKHLSFSKAAEKLHLTPPAVTMQVKELEANIGLPLFHRQGRQVSLTTVGEYMLVYVRKILSTLKDAEDAVARLQHAEMGVLHVGMVSTAKYFLLKMMAEFREKHEAVDFRISIGNREQLVRMLEGNEVDIAVMGRPPKDLEVRAEPFAAHPHVFVASVGHLLAKRGHLTVEDLRQYEFIAREQGSGTRAAMEKFFADARLDPRIKMEFPSNETLKQAVMAGLGIGFVSLHTIGFELQHQQVAVLDVQSTPVVRAWNVVHKRSKILSPAAEAFRYFILEHGEAYLANQFGSFLDMEGK